MSAYLLYRCGAAFIRAVPRPFAYWMGLRAADRRYARNGPDRHAVVSNLRQIYRAKGIEPSRDVLEGVARKTFQHFGKYIADFIRYTRLKPRDMDRLFSAEHMDYLHECRGNGRGTILATAHFGNWELGGAVITAKGYHVHTVFMPEEMQERNRFFLEIRRQRGFSLKPYGHAAKDMLRLLRQGEMVTLLADRDFSNRDDRIPFFGKPARLPRGPAALSMKTGAPILPGFLLRQVDDTFLMRAHKPLDPLEIGDEYEMRCELGRVLEKEIGENPHQWFIFHDFWNHNGQTESI